MKKIFLVCAVAMSFMAAEAQTSKKSSKKSKSSKEAKAKAESARLEKERYDNAEMARLDRLAYDSLRLDNERLADSTFDAGRIAWKDSMIRTIDSTNNENWKVQIADVEKRYEIERSRDEIIKNAKLTSNQGRQVKYINQLYHDKAKAVQDNTSLTEEQKKAQYVALNTERRARISAIIGKSREKKLEKERQEYREKNTVDVSQNWIDAVASKKN